jgi:hypothetical protein
MKKNIRSSGSIWNPDSAENRSLSPAEAPIHQFRRELRILLKEDGSDIDRCDLRAPISHKKNVRTQDSISAGPSEILRRPNQTACESRAFGAGRASM